MTEKIGIIFSQTPHTNSSGREGLDAVLALSSLTSSIALFFLGDGVYHLLTGQQPAQILSRDYPATLMALPFYDVAEYYVCETSLQQRCLQRADLLLLPCQHVSEQALRKQLDACTKLLTF